MKNKPTLSTNKIIVFVVFVCAAIMTSLFVFHMSHKTTTQTVDNHHIMIFSSPRDIKPFELVSTNGKPFNQSVFSQHWTLLFFGFTHCSSICPTTLEYLSKVYTKLRTEYPTLQVVLISLDPERDNMERLRNYTHSFHPDFLSASGKIQEVRKLQSQLGIYSASQPNSDQLTHSASILLINPQGKWAGLFTSDIPPEQFTQSFKQHVDMITHA